MSFEGIRRLSKPRNQSVHFLPDRPSVYWLDYIPDPTPHSITNGKELLRYYQTQWFTKYSRVEELSQPKSWPDINNYPRPSTVYGTQISALNYVPSERIKILAQPSQREDTSIVEDSSVKLPPIDKRKDKQDTHDGWDWTRLPKTSLQRALETATTSRSQPTVDMSKGDFPARSRLRQAGVTRSSTGTSNKTRTPNSNRFPFQHGQGENQNSYLRSGADQGPKSFQK